MKPTAEKSTEATVRMVLEMQLGINQDAITPTAKLWDDLSVDSLDAVEIVMALEEELEIAIPDEALDDANAKTVADLIAFVERARSSTTRVPREG